MKTNNLQFIFLSLAIIISPFTSLRFSFFGLAELIILIFVFFIFLKGFSYGILKRCLFTKFWCIFLAISLIGFIFNVVFLNHKTGSFEGMFFDFSAYIFVLLTCLYLEISFLTKKHDPYKLFKTTFYGLTLILIVLYIISFYTPTLFGLTLRKYDFFVPLVINVHQISMILVILPFMGLFMLKEDKNFLVSIILLLSIGVLIPMGLETGSTKALLSILFGFVMFFLFKFLLIGGLKLIPITIVFSLMLLLITLSQIDVLTYARIFFIENDGQGARSMIYSNALETALTSPIFGLGTGPHVLRGGKFWDSHQTHLTIFLQTGIIGIIAYLMLMLNVFKKTYVSPALIGALTAITLYSLGGDLLRRLPIWILLTIIYYTAINYRNGIK